MLQIAEEAEYMPPSLNEDEQKLYISLIAANCKYISGLSADIAKRYGVQI